MTVSGVQAVGVMGAILRGGGAVQSWVKPTEAPGEAEEAHRRWPRGRSEQGREKGKGLPSRVCALPRGSYLGEGSSSSHDPFFSRAAASEGSMTVSGVQAVGVMGAILRGGGAVQSWVKPTEAPGGAEEAHRRWPRGRSKHGREQGKG